MQRLHFKHEKTFKEQLIEEAKRLRDEAAQLPYGKDRQLLLKRAQQAETASHLDEWLTSPGLQPPK